MTAAAVRKSAATPKPPPLPLIQQLGAVIQAYATATGKKISSVSTSATGDGDVLCRIAEGRSDVTTARFEKIMLWFSQNWPKETPWPTGILRPKG